MPARPISSTASWRRFARQDPTLLLCCEEGEEEYEKNALDNVTVITIEDEEDLKCSYLKELEKEYHPKQVLIEYNGMCRWSGCTGRFCPPTGCCTRS